MIHRATYWLCVLGVRDPTTDGEVRRFNFGIWTLVSIFFSFKFCFSKANIYLNVLEYYAESTSPMYFGNLLNMTPRTSIIFWVVHAMYLLQSGNLVYENVGRSFCSATGVQLSLS